MDIQKAKQIVCDAGLKLVKEGLVARTWGNISCRIDKDSFVITPSGRTYEDLTPDDIVQIRIEDCQWSGDVKPSSEKGLHAEVYKLNDDYTAVIHTHQRNASVVASARKDIPRINDKMAQIIGETIPCAAYGLPGTGKLKKGTAAALKRAGSKAALMANHGAVCAGTDMNDAFTVAITLEEICDLYVQQEFKKLSSLSKSDEATMHEYYLKEIIGRKNG